MTRDVKDFEAYGGTIPPRPSSVSKPTKNADFTQKEHKANQFDFSATQHRWVNRTVSQEQGYESLSDGFKRLFNDKKVLGIIMCRT